VVGRWNLASLAPQIEACNELIEENNGIDVAVFGTFKSGKSSFLNSLAGANLLPVGVVPVTAIITRLRFAESLQASVKFLSGENRRVPLDEITAYITESKNPANAKGVADVLIQTPSLKMHAGLQFIDTPGLNSIFTHNSQTSRNWLPRVGAALLAVSADHPFSEQDAALLKDLLRFTPRVIILLTKADLLNPEQMKEVKDFIAQQINSIVTKPIPIFPFSIRDELYPLRESFQRDMLSPLTQSRITESETILRHKLKTLLTDALMYFDIGLAAAEKDESSRANLREQVLNRENNSEAVREELRLIERDCSGQARSQVEEVVERHHARLRTEVLSELRAQQAEWKLNLWKWSRAYEAWLQEVLTKKMLALSKLENHVLSAPLESGERRIARAVDNFKNRLAANVEHALGIKMSEAEWRGQIKAPDRADISISPAFDIHLDSLWFLLPMPLIKGWTRRHFLRKVPWEIEKNLSRLETQWTESIDARIRDLKRQAEIHVETEIKTIECLLAQQLTQIPEFEQAKKELVELRRLLDSDNL